jgi:hypothetical protein
MNFDVKLWLDNIAENAQPILAALFLFYLVTRLLRTSLAKRLWAKLEETVFSSWQLALLGITGFILSCASGYTTWDGMRNFTGEGVLSGMITFGIQGVMLIVAWLIGESFATGMNMQSQHSQSRLVDPQTQTILGAVIGVLLFVTGIVLVLQLTGQADIRQASADNLEWSKTGDKLTIFAFGLLLAALFALYAASDLIRPYIQGARVVIRNSMLWLMFLACMATSVFFSFDSLFTSIFPQSERVRAAELRAQNQVAGIITDIEGVIAERNASEQQNLLQSDAWTSYEKNLSQIAGIASTSQGALERYINAQIEDRRRAVKDQQERMASAQAGQAGLAQRKIALTEEKSRLASERPALAGEYAEKKADLDAKGRDIDAKRVEALAEDKGVEGTGKQGRGPMYRQRMGELAQLQNVYKIAEERTKDAQKRLTAAESRLATIDRELATIDGDLAKLKGEAETAEQRIVLAEETAKGDVGQRMDPSRLVPTFERTIAEFRERPSSEKLASVQSICGDIYSALQQTPETKDQLSGLDCDPKRTSDAAANLWALQAGIQTFAGTCMGGDKLIANKTADDLFGFARRCLQDSALPSQDTDALRTKINSIELARDDKAHRFVVTWNAFTDGNRLAYLALAIAIAIDSLIFMSGLFGANAVRSPLSDVPTAKARSASQLEATINAALGTHPHDTAWLTISALRPVTNVDGFSAIAELDRLEKSVRDRVRNVLTAGADIGAVETVSHQPEVYRVRSELREYLSIVCDKHFKNDETAKDSARLQQVIRNALAPHAQEHADLVLKHLKPEKEEKGFTSRLELGRITDPYENEVVRRVIIAASSEGAAVTDKNVEDGFWIKSELNVALLNVRATAEASGVYKRERSLPSMLQSALKPYVFENAEIFISTLAPTRNVEQFTSYVATSAITDPYCLGVVNRVLNVGTATGLVVPDQLEGDKFYVHGDFYEAVLEMRANSTPSAAFTDYHRNTVERYAGRLDDAQASLPLEPEAPQIARPQPKLAALSQEQYNQLRTYYREEMLGAIGLRSDIVDERLATPLARKAMVDAYKALLAVGRSNSDLDRYLSNFQKKQRAALEDILLRLVDETSDDPRKRQILESVQDQVESDHSAYMLFPECEMITYLIEELERAAQPDEGLRQDEHALMEKLRHVRNGLDALDLTDPNSWAEINQRLAARPGRLPNFMNKRNPGET